MTPPVPTSARSYQGRRAGVVTRLTANAIDLLVVIVVLALIYAALAGFRFLLDPRGFSWPQQLGWTIPVIGFAVVTPYLTLAWVTTGRTYGDALLGLRVVTARGRRLRFGHALLRALACVLFPIGILWIPISRRNESVQDILVRTSVIYDWTAHTTTR